MAACKARRFVEHSAQIDEVLLQSRAFLNLRCPPLRDELTGRHGSSMRSKTRRRPDRLDMLLRAVTRPEDERDRDALIELARRNRAWPEETLAFFRRHVREAVDPDDRFSLSRLEQGLPADLARSFENLSGECWRHMGEALRRRQELTRGHGLSY